MKLFFLLAALIAIVYSQNEFCRTYCIGMDNPPNCVPYFMNFTETACYRQCYNNCVTAGIPNCLARYRCCMDQPQFSSNGCTGLMS